MHACNPFTYLIVRTYVHETIVFMKVGNIFKTFSLETEIQTTIYIRYIGHVGISV